MVPKLFLSNQTIHRSEYDILQIWLNIIYHNMCIKGVKVDIFFSGTFCRLSLVLQWESEWGWTYIHLVPQ